MRKILALLVILVAVWFGYSVLVHKGILKATLPTFSVSPSTVVNQPVKVVSEESVTIDAVKKIGPSVVTVVGTATMQPDQIPQSPFDQFFGMQLPPDQGQQQPTQQSIGSGFIVSTDGLIVTNKHVVADTTEKYQVVTADSKKYDVQNIYRDPNNDIAILKINPTQNSGTKLTPVPMGDSSNLQVGQFVIAIGTALGQFNNTVTTGVISGLGRGIQAGDEYQGYVEQLDNVIQTSAAINPGNSGGPLVNSSSQVIGVNTAVAQNGQNIGFALPINVIKTSLSNFNATGQFNRAFLGVSYQMISQQMALLNNVPMGAYVQSVVSGSAADKAGIQQGDIIMSINGTRIDDKNNTLEDLVGKYKVGDSVTITLWRNNNTMDVKATFGASSQ